MFKHNKISSENIPRNRLQSSAFSALNFQTWAGATLIISVVLLVYFPSVRGGFLLDDNIILTDNEFITAPDGLYRFWFTTQPLDYWPVANTSLWLEWRLWGNNPTGYHLVNLVLHIAAALLLWAVLRKLAIPAAFFGALLFAVHPVNVESVAWIAQRKGLLAMVFFLLSIWCYLIFESQPADADRSPTVHRILFYYLSLLAFVLAMLSKGSVAILPLVLLGITAWLRPLTLKDLWRAAPFFLVAAMLIPVNLWFQTHGLGNGIRNAGFVERLLGAGAAIWFYLYKALLPLNLMFIYPEWGIRIGNWLWWLPLIGALIVTAILWWYRGGWSRPLLYAWGFFCVGLLPVLGFTDVGFMMYSLVADHYQHPAIMGVLAPAAAGWSLWHEAARRAARWKSSAVGIAAVGMLMFFSWRQSGLYCDAKTLYQETLRKNPGCWMAYNNLGLILGEEGKTPESIEFFQKSLQLNPDYPKAHNNLANAFLHTGRIQDALGEYQQAIRLKSDYYEAVFNLGNAFLQAGRLAEAIEQYRQALEIKPDFVQAQNNLGAVLAKMGDYQGAIKHYQQAIQSKPDYFDAIYNLGSVLEQINRPQEARTRYEQVLRIKPDYYKAHYHLGNLLLRNGQVQQSIEHYQYALRLKPDYIEAYANLALALSRANRPKEAVAAAQKGLDIARSQGQTAMAKQIEDWLKSFRVEPPDDPSAAQPAK